METSLLTVPSGVPVQRIVRQHARSRLSRVKGPSDKSASGSEVKRCGACSLSERQTKETIHNGLQLLRVRYGLPYSELPDCDPSSLGRFHLFLLQQGKERASVVFPRRQVRRKDGLCHLQRLGRRARWELALSVASIKRNLPSGCRTHTPSVRSSWETNACSQPPPVDPEYLQHVRRVCTRIFTSGWDKHYDSYVGNHLPNPTARKPLLSRADHLWAGRREEFIAKCRDESMGMDLMSCRYKEVQSAGKKRPLLIFDEDVDLLAPMHRMVYDHMARSTDWLLVGPPTNERINSVCVNEVQTSVDLISASDGLAHEVSNAILDCLFFTSVKIPRSLRRLAKASLTPIFRCEDGQLRRVRHGQNMGSYMCFPLLCLHSFCAASWAARDCGDSRFLVNGDDCLVSSDRGIGVQDYPYGYRLNATKTTVSKNVAEVNSTVFLKSRGRWREVRHPRRVGAVSDYPGMMHMAKACAFDPKMMDAYSRTRIGRRWGFLPSQLGHVSYASHLRERQMRVSRTYTDLPADPLEVSVPASLRRIVGRNATPLEAEALRSFFWSQGRMGGLKRDVYSPSCGKIRRSYCYRGVPCKSFLSYVGSRVPKLCALRRKAPVFFLLPEEFETEEEGVGLMKLEFWRNAIDSLAIERRE
nr:MAG: RNA-dependent RNA polymerase [Botourmiaviridae sp.]